MLLQEDLLEYLRDIQQIEALRSLMLHLIRRSSTWQALSRGHTRNFLLGAQPLYNTISEFLRIEEISDSKTRSEI